MELAAHQTSTRSQGDEKEPPADFFTPLCTADKLHKSFLALTTSEEFSPAREIIGPMMRWYEDVDGNFIEQFQTSGLDARVWELYLFAAFHEMEYAIDRSEAVPDFSCRGIPGGFYVEAMTVNATRDAKGAIVPPPPTE
ncbi:MAG: hypothetical protein ABL962_20945, partial [Fimbriimonadaceae bacterium]